MRFCRQWKYKEEMFKKQVGGTINRIFFFKTSGCGREGKKRMILRFLGEMTSVSLIKSMNTGGSKFEINMVWVTVNFDDTASHLPLLFLTLITT